MVERLTAEAGRPRPRLIFVVTPQRWELCVVDVLGSGHLQWDASAEGAAAVGPLAEESRTTVRRSMMAHYVFRSALHVCQPLRGARGERERQARIENIIERERFGAPSGSAERSAAALAEVMMYAS